MASQTDTNELLDLSKCFRCYSAADQLAIQTYIIANSRSLTDPSTLLELAKDFAGVSTRRLLSIISYLLADIGNLDTDADALAERAICYSCVPAESLTAIQTYLLSIDPSAPDATTSELLDLAACFRGLSLRDNLNIITGMSGK